MEYKIDASNKILGRLASEIAMILRGKNNPRFDPSKLGKDRVFVENTDQIRVTGRKLKQKIYRHHSGYHGGLKEEKLHDLLARDSRLVLRRAILGMLPKNKSRKQLIKNLKLAKGKA